MRSAGLNSAALDRWIMREPPEPKCSACGRYIGDPDEDSDRFSCCDPASCQSEAEFARDAWADSENDFRRTESV